MRFQDRLQLNEGDSLRENGSRTKGTMGQTEIDYYDVIDAAGTKVGEVTYEDHTNLKGFKRTVTIEQRDVAGAVVVRTSFAPD